MKKRVPQVILLAVLLLTSAACSDTVPPAEDHITQSTKDETTNQIIQPTFLPEGLDYNGETVCFLTTCGEISKNKDEFETGDIINEAIYNRTLLAEEKLHLDITAEDVDFQESSNILSMSVNAGDGAYDGVADRFTNQVTALQKGYLTDLHSISTLNLSQSWWDQKVNESATTYGAQFVATGDIIYYDDYSVHCFVFNKKQFGNQGIEEPYASVLDGTWTYDKMYMIPFRI